MNTETEVCTTKIQNINKDQVKLKITPRHKIDQLGPRLHILKTLVYRYHAKGKEIANVQTKIQAFIENLLVKHDYDLEKLITEYRKITLPLQDYNLICEQCRYLHQFCRCSIDV